jgi:hypothetical protein
MLLAMVRMAEACSQVGAARFGDPNLVAYGGLEPVVRLAERCGLGELAGELMRLPKSKDGTGAFVAAKLMTLIAGMVAGADSIDDMDRLRHAGGRLVLLLVFLHPATKCFRIQAKFASGLGDRLA